MIPSTLSVVVLQLNLRERFPTHLGRRYTQFTRSMSCRASQPLHAAIQVNLSAVVVTALDSASRNVTPVAASAAGTRTRLLVWHAAAATTAATRATAFPQVEEVRLLFVLLRA